MAYRWEHNCASVTYSNSPLVRPGITPCVHICQYRRSGLLLRTEGCTYPRDKNFYRLLSITTKFRRTHITTWIAQGQPRRAGWVAVVVCGSARVGCYPEAACHCVLHATCKAVVAQGRHAAWMMDGVDVKSREDIKGFEDHTACSCPTPRYITSSHHLIWENTQEGGTSDPLGEEVTLSNADTAT